MTETTIFNVVRFKGSSPFVKRKRIDNWDTTHALTLVDPKEYRYFWFEEVEMTCDRSDGILTVRTNTLQKSHKFFIDAYTETYEDVLVRDPTLAGQMENMGCKYIAQSIDPDTNWVEYFDFGVDSIIKTIGD
jgi:hypothetical protein